MRHFLRHELGRLPLPIPSLASSVQTFGPWPPPVLGSGALERLLADYRPALPA